MKRPSVHALSEELFDLVVIGGGVTGAATARDAALRGLSVLLVEKEDFASGTSSRSSKLIHGGLRYLETYQFGLVAESVREREKMLRLAPHLTEVRPFLYLLYDGYPEGKAIMNLGLTFYDVVSGSWWARRHSMLSAKKTLAREPHLRAEGLRGSGLYYDVLTDDARFTVESVKGAVEASAVAINHAAVTGLILENGKCRGVKITDSLTGESTEVHARQVVSAVGPWTDKVRELEETQSTHRLRPTKGVHIVVKKSDFPLNTAVFLRSPSDNRMVWPIPSLEDDVVYIGTTDTDYTGDLDKVQPDEADVEYLLEVANHTIPEARLTQSHIVGSWAGLRPLIAPAPGTSTADTPREHAITTGPTGLITISGGKLTSNRVMAKHLVDAALKALGQRKGKYLAGKTTVSGGGDTAQLAAVAKQAGVPFELAALWRRRYGSNTGKLIKIWQKSDDAKQIIGARSLTRAELTYLVEEEMATTLSDLLVRRTSVFFWDAAGGMDEVEQVAAELGTLLGWTDERRIAEIAAYKKLVDEHRPGGWQN